MEPFHTVGRKVNWYSNYEEQYGDSLKKKLGLKLPYDSPIPLLDIYPMCVFVAQSCLTLCDTMNCSLPGSSVHGSCRARILQWVTISFSTIYPEKTAIEKDTCTSMFTAALFTTARTWKQPRCLSTDEQIKKLWYIYTMEYYSVIKGTHLSLF